MMTKTAYYMQMAQEAAAQITGSKEQWTAFLTTSARLYKYPFAEQLMIYMDLCQYFEHKKLKGYADFFNSSSSFCCGVI